jgi:filamentous hemagglutinin family protein
LLVLAALGLIGLGLPQRAAAQTRAQLPAGTLPVLRGVVSGQAVVNAPAPGAAQSLMTIDQSTQRAIIDWRSFNIAGDSEVLFRQPSTSSSALNRIYDANPSVIQGKLTANGQVLLINQNGILFDRGAQVNTQSLIASSLNITNERFLSGVLTGGGLTTPAFAGGYDANGAPLAARSDGTRPADIAIGGAGAPGAAAPTLDAKAGGSIVLIAPNIDNNGGVIRAPDGQVILAAGNRAYLALNENSSDVTLRGLVVEVEAAPGGSPLNITNLIRNAGEVSADRGNVTLASLAINQEGRISAKTAVQNNGSIFLTARARNASGSDSVSGGVNFAAGSLTEVTPDRADKTTVPDAQSYEPYRGVIRASGRTIESAGTLKAEGGRIVLDASDTTDPSGARVYLHAGSQTSVAGAWSDVDLDKNIVSFRVTSNELKNSPDQRDGVLRGAKVSVDLRQGNNILELGGYRDIVARTVAEKAGAGGELEISSTGSVIQRSGALIDASGGGYRYDSGTVTTTRLLGDDGRIYDIASAPKDRIYNQLLDRYERRDDRWGQTLSLANPLGSVGEFQSAHVQGLNGGLVTVNAGAGLVLDGELRGGVTVGPRQLSSAPRGATLRIGEFRATTPPNLGEGQFIGNTTWRQNASDTLGASFMSNTALTALQRDGFTLAATQVFGPATSGADGLVETGFGAVELNVNGRIDVPRDVAISGAAGSSLTLRAPVIDVAGDITLPAGNLSLRPVVPTGAAPELANATERVVVREGANLSTAGAWINRSAADGSPVGSTIPLARANADGSSPSRSIDGGSISIQIDLSAYQVRLDGGSSLDVGGGASIDANRRVTGGRGGVLNIANGTANQSTSDWLRADLNGLAIGNGGQLNLNLGRLLIDDDGAEGVLPSDATRVGTSLFGDFGFSRVNVTAANGITVAAGTELTLRQKNLVVDPRTAITQASGTSLSSFAESQWLPPSSRAPASLVLNARGGGVAGAGKLTIERDAQINTDARADVSLSAVDGLVIDGRIRAPGGRVTATLNGALGTTAPDLRIGRGAEISTAAVFVPTPNDRGLVQGNLVDAGSVTIDARNTGLNIDSGAVIDVSGTRVAVDVADNNSAQPGFDPRTLDAQAGSIVLKSQGRTAIEGALVGRAASPTAAGGSFALEMLRPDGQTVLPAARRIVVTPSGTSLAPQADFVDAAVNVDLLTARGFDKLRLQSENVIEFRGDTTLDFARGIRLDAPLLDLAGDARVNLRGSTVSMGQSLGARERQTGGDPVWQITEGTSLPAQATRSGPGSLDVDAGSVNLFGSLTVNGAAQVRIASDNDVNLIGRSINFASTGGGQGSSRQIGSFTTAADIELVASQVLPATRTDFTIAARPQGNTGSTIRVTGNGSEAGTAYSAGARLALEADRIVQGGTLKAPQGEISLKATSALELAPGSVTSVSGDGTTVPYGTTVAGVLWRYTDGNAAQTNLSAVTPEGKRIGLDAPRIDVASGATVDMRGGGGVQALEFVPGNGGDADITLQDNTFAIIPAARLAAMPYDRHTQGQKDVGFGFSVTNGRDTSIFDSILIGAGGAVPAGEYALLPARYALLPDAFLVKLQTGSTYRDWQPGQVGKLANGETVLGAVRSVGGTAVQASQGIGVVINPGSAARRASDYNVSGAAFFADAATLERRAAPRAPWDAGRLAVENAAALSLAGRIETAATTAPDKTPGRTAEVDIGGSRIAIVDKVGDPTVPVGYLQIEGSALSRLGGSVLIGGKRSDTDSGIRITTSASDLLVANNERSAVDLPELILAARSSVEVREGSVLAATGSPAAGEGSVIASEATGALVRLSSGPQAIVDRGSAGIASGDVRIASGASLSADASLLIDATRSTQSAGQLRAGGVGGAGGSLSLASSRVSAGQTAGLDPASSGLVLSNADLSTYAGLDEFVLRGYSGIDLVGNASLGSPALERLVLDTPLLQGRVATDGTTAQASIAAANVELRNNRNLSATSATGGGRLDVRADQLVLGNGAKAISGFGSVQFVARNALLSDGKGQLDVAATLTLDTPLLVAQGGSQQTVSAVDRSRPEPVFSSLVVTGDGAAPSTSAAGEFGGRLALEGSDIRVDSTIEARSGQIALLAQGPGGIRLDDGARLDASGQAKDFNGTVVTADGGGVTLQAGAAVAVSRGARVDVSAAAAGGNAGRVDVRAASLTLEGQLAGSAGNGARSGSVQLDLDRLADFSFLNGALNRGGFAEERSLRVRSGDIGVAVADQVAARRVAISADAGSIQVAGSVGSGAADGGARISLNASGDIDLAAGSRLVAGGSAAGARGGDVRVVSSGGSVTFDAGSTIDVRAGQEGPAGSMVFGVARGSDDTLAATRLEGRILRQGGSAPASVDVQATRRYEVGPSVDGATIDALAADHEAFVARTGPAATAAVMGGLRDENGALAGGRIVGGVELRRGGDLRLDKAWDLTTPQWLSGLKPGTLTVRASGDVTLSQSIGSPDANILATDTWSLRLVAGADLGAANPLDTLAAAAPGKGSLRLSGADAKLRTGTGRIDLAASRDIAIDDPAAVIYTAGRIGAPDTDPLGTNRWATDGGGISMRAGGQISGALGNAGELWIGEWLRRPSPLADRFGELRLTDWWAFRPRVQQVVATLAGGDIDIAAGGNVSNLFVAAPTTGRTWRDGTGTRQVDVQGGGNLEVRAGGDLFGSSFLLGRGQARIEAAGDVGAGRATQLFVMGASSGAVPAKASVDLVAGGALNLQGIANPTAMLVTSVPFDFDDENAVLDPSIGDNSGVFSTFFSYSGNSVARLRAKNGNLSYAGTLHPRWRTLDPNNAITPTQTNAPGAYPASLSLVALDGDLVGSLGPDLITTFPSTTATVQMLASGSLVNVGFYASDRAPETVVTPTTRVEAAAVRGPIDGRVGLRPAPNQARILEREVEQPFAFELQALTGDIRSGSTASANVLTAPARIRAGRDIVGGRILLQNLDDDDLSIVRADQGDIRNPQSIEIAGPGRLIVQAGRNIDLGEAFTTGPTGDIGGLVASGNTTNPRLPSSQSARVTVVAGVKGDIDLTRMDSAYASIVRLNGSSNEIIDLYRQLGTENDAEKILAAADVMTLAAQDSTYARFVGLDRRAPEALRAYQDALRSRSLPLVAGAESQAAQDLYKLLNTEPDVQKLQSAGSVAALAAGPGGAAYQPFVALDQSYPRVFSDYVARRSQGALPTGVTPIVFSNALADVVATVVKPADVSGGGIASYQTSIQTYGGSAIDLWAPGGNLVVGLTTPRTNRQVGVLTNTGGAVRSVVAGNFDINQGKVITVQGGDVLILSTEGSIDAGRGARTSLTTPPPTRTPVFETIDGQRVQVGVLLTIPQSAAGSGIQSLSSDPDGIGPLPAPKAGDVYLFAPAGSIDAGEAGIRSSGNLVLNAQTVLNAANISVSGASTGVPVAVAGSLASSLASSGSAATSATSKAGEDAAGASGSAARSAAATQIAKPTILVVEVIGFGDKNCKEGDKDCFAK